MKVTRCYKDYYELSCKFIKVNSPLLIGEERFYAGTGENPNNNNPHKIL